MPDVLIWGDTIRSPVLRHELPLSIGDPFLYMETDGRRAVVTQVLEADRIAAVAPSTELLMIEDLGVDELIEKGLPVPEIERELAARAVGRLGIREAIVPRDFPLALADRLRADGVALEPSDQHFDERRRSKTTAELDGIRRASRAGLAALGEAARMLREAEIEGDELRLEGELLTAEAVRARMREVCARAGAPAPEDIMVVAMGAEPSLGHDPGSGPLPPHTPIEIDLWPQDEASACWSDMTRTFVRGEVSDAVAAMHATVLEAHERACAAVRPGVRGGELFGVACDVIEAAGHATTRTKEPGETLRHGFYFALGHGVGLEVHEPPVLGRTGPETIVVGDVLAIEPGLTEPGIGGTRVEDLIVVGEDGCENLTAAFPYGLTPE